MLNYFGDKSNRKKNWNFESKKLFGLKDRVTLYVLTKSGTNFDHFAWTAVSEMRLRA
jgi:hypothetical protein